MNINDFMDTLPKKNEYYTFDELRALGCPEGLLMQYICMTKAEVDNLYRDKTTKIQIKFEDGTLGEERVKERSSETVNTDFMNCLPPAVKERTDFVNSLFAPTSPPKDSDKTESAPVELLKVTDTPTPDLYNHYYSHGMYCSNCGNHFTKYIRKGLRVRTVSDLIICSNCEVPWNQ